MSGASGGRSTSPTSMLLMVFLVLSLVAGFSMPALADEHKGDWDQDHYWQHGSVDFQRDNSSFYLHSKATGNDTTDDLYLEVNTHEGLSVQTVLKHSGDRVATRMSIVVDFKCLVGLKEGETVGQVPCDGNTSGRSVLLFSDMSFGEPHYSNYTSQDVKIHKVDIYTKDGRFDLKVEMSGDFDRSNATSDPEPMKMHVKVHEFKYAKDDKQLGLNMEVRSNLVITVKKDLIEHDGTGIDTVEKRGPSDGKDEELGSTVLALNDQATVDGCSEAVTTAVSDNGNDGMHVSVAYPRGETIQQDMEMSISPSPIVLKGSAPVYIAGIGAVAAVFALTDKHVLALLARKAK